MEEDKAEATGSAGQQVGSQLARSKAGHAIRIDEASHEILESYRLWLEGRALRRVPMAEAVRDLLIEKAKEVLLEQRGGAFRPVATKPCNKPLDGPRFGA